MRRGRGSPAGSASACRGEYYNCQLNVDGRRMRATRHICDELTDYAIDWLRQERDKPFFLYLSHKAVHAMFEPAKRHLGRYENVTVEYPRSMADTEENYKGKPAWVKEQRNSWHGVDYMYHGQMDFDHVLQAVLRDAAERRRQHRTRAGLPQGEG
jgi:hypothetical protein